MSDQDAAAVAIARMQETLDRHQRAIESNAAGGVALAGDGAKRIFALEESLERVTADLAKQSDAVSRLGANVVELQERLAAALGLETRIDSLACDVAELNAGVEQLADRETQRAKGTLE